MQNLTDYSQFVDAAYSIAGIMLTLLFVFVVRKYLALKSKIKNAK